MNTKEKNAFTQYIASILDGQPDMNLSHSGTSYTQYQLTRILANQCPMQKLITAVFLVLVGACSDLTGCESCGELGSSDAGAAGSDAGAAGAAGSDDSDAGS